MLALEIHILYNVDTVCVCVCDTCRGRLSTRQQNPKAISSRLVRMKALMALVTFWILPSLLGPLVWLMGHRHTDELTLGHCVHLYSSIQLILLLTDCMYLFSASGPPVFSVLHSFIFQSMMYPIRGHVSRHSSCSVPNMDE